MIRFLTEKCGIIADTNKAFLQLSVAKYDRNVLGFLW